MQYQPSWLSEELNKKLGQIVGHNARKKRQTVLRLAEARAMGAIESEVYKLPECCTKMCWYGKYKDGKRLPGWRDDPIIAEALEAATARAQHWQDTAEARRIAKRQEHLAEARDKLAEYSPAAVSRLFVLMGRAGNEETRRKAANDILDRASEDTAAKAVVQQTGEDERTHKFDFSQVPTELLELFVDTFQGAAEGDAEGRDGGTE